MKRSMWWQGAAPQSTLPSLSSDQNTDVVVVGAGITGLTTALLLARAGQRVVVLEGEHVGAGTTGHTSAHLTVETDTDLDELVRRVGEGGASAGVRANRIGIERIAQLDREMGGRGEFARVPGYLWAVQDSDLPRLERMAALYVAAGEAATTPVEVPLPGAYRGLRLENQALFQPVRYLQGLVDLALAEGVQIFEQSEVLDWDSGDPVRVVARGGVVTARHVVLATHTPPGMVPTVQTRLAPYLSFLLAVRPAHPIPPALYWDMADPYHYLRPLPDGLWLVGGADRKPGAGDPHAQLAELEEWARVTLGAGEVAASWAHMWFEPADGLPYIGALPTRTGAWVATGFSGTGLTWGTYAAERLVDQILGKEGEDDKHFSPARLSLLGSADRLVQDQASVAWHMIADRLKPQGDHHPEDLAPGEGRVLTIDGRKVGVYRADDGELYGVSTVCKHLGCLVEWNGLDRTWDCPCHGGRYRADGKRFWGPPMSDLELKKLG